MFSVVLKKKIGNNEIQYLGIAPIFNALKQNKTLQTLDLSMLFQKQNKKGENNLDNASAFLLSEMLKINNSLVNLNICIFSEYNYRPKSY